LLNAPENKALFLEKISKPIVGSKYVALTSDPFYAKKIMSDVCTSIYLTDEPEENAFSINEFVDLLLGFKYPFIKDVFFLPICKKAFNNILTDTFDRREYSYSRTAWKAFQRGPDFFQNHPDELMKAAQCLIDTCEGKSIESTAGNPANNDNTNKDENQSAGDKFTVMSAQELQKADLPPIRFIVDEILPQGLILLCSPAKYGKSWMTLDLCLSVASGAKFLGFTTEKCGVLYLALEDSYRRLKTRMNAILKDNAAPEGFDYVINAPTLDNGLDTYLRQYIKGHPNVGLIAIDVLQKVRSTARLGGNAYAAEYADLTILKKVADEFNIVILLLHHNRKMTDGSDPFNMISGTMALMGTADTSLILYREKRTDEQTILSITGRDVEMNSYKIAWDKQTSRQKLIGSVDDIQAVNDKDEYNTDSVVITIKSLLKKDPKGVTRTAGDFLAEIPKCAGVIFKGNEKKLGCHFVKLEPKLYLYDRIIHKKERRFHTFKHDDEKIVQFPSFEQDSIIDDDSNPFL